MATGVSFADLLYTQGRYQVRPTLPFAPGMDAVVDPRPLTEPGDLGRPAARGPKQRHPAERDPERERFAKEWQSFARGFCC